MISEEEYRRIGVEIMQRDPAGRSEKVFERRWITFFGVTLEVATELWNRLRIDINDPEFFAAGPQHLLWALLFLKIYGAETELCHIVGGPDEKTFRKWSRFFVEQISFIMFDVVRVVNRVCILYFDSITHFYSL